MLKFILISFLLGLSAHAAYSPACDAQVKKITQSSSRSVLPDIVFQGRDIPYEVTPFLQKLLSDYGKRAPQVFQRDSFYRISSFIISEADVFHLGSRIGRIISISNSLYKPGLLTYVTDTQNRVLSITPFNGQTVWVCQSSN